jgi:hypothetical protein
MTESYRFEKAYQKFSDKLLKEARPYLVGEPIVWRKRVADNESSGSQTKQKLKAALPGLKGELRSDVLVFHDLPTEQGLLHVVHSYARKTLMPPEFLLAIEGRIPGAAVLNRAPLDAGVWTTASGTEKDGEEFCVFLKDIKRGKGLRARRLAHEAEWTQEMGGIKIKLDWAMQLAPLGEESFLFLFRIPYQLGLLGISRFGVEKYLNAASWVKESVASLEYAGEAPKRGMLQPTLALLALPQVRGDSERAGGAAVTR